MVALATVAGAALTGTGCKNDVQSTVFILMGVHWNRWPIVLSPAPHSGPLARRLGGPVSPLSCLLLPDLLFCVDVGSRNDGVANNDLLFS